MLVLTLTLGCSIGVAHGMLSYKVTGKYPEFVLVMRAAVEIIELAPIGFFVGIVQGLTFALLR